MSDTSTTVYVGQRDVVSVSGEEAVTYLQGQLSQDVQSLPLGESRWSFILQPQGKVDAWFRVTRTADDAFLLDVDAGYGEVLLARLKRFKLRTKADLSLDTWTLHAYLGDVPEGAEASIVSPSADERGTDLIGPELAEPAGVVIDDEQYEHRRILAAIPAMGSELDDSTIPAESGMVDRSVSFTKGCYTGQELVARVDSRGNNTPRRLRIISGRGDVPEARELYAGETIAGTVTSIVRDGDGWIGLAYVKRSAFDETTLQIQDAVAEVRPGSSEPGKPGS